MKKFKKMSKKHTRLYRLKNLFVYGFMLFSAIYVISTSNIELPSVVSKYSAGMGFILICVFTGFAMASRVQNLFKIHSIGFLFMFLLFLGIKFIIDPVVLLLGLLLIPMLIDDIILVPIFNNIWYNNYDK